MRLHFITRNYVLVLTCLLAACSSNTPRTEKGSKSAAVNKVEEKANALPGGKVWITKPDGSQSCGVEAGLSLPQAAAELKKAGVKVYQQRAGQDGRMHMMVCGAATGNTVEALIDAAQYSQAEKLGYHTKNKPE